jgi:hypothetical protein
MRRLLQFSLVATLALGGTSSKSKSSERRQPIPMPPSLRSDSVDAATLKALLNPSFEITTTEHFVLLHEPGAAYVSRTGTALERAYAEFYRLLRQAGFNLARSRNPLVWICFPDQNDFNAYTLQVEAMDLSWLDGYYSTLTNRVAIVQPNQPTFGPGESDPLPERRARGPEAAQGRPGAGILPMPAGGLDIGRLTHELAHQLAFSSGLQKRGVMYPLWVSEGLTTNFEFEESATPSLERCHTVRCRSVLEMRAAGELIPLRQFVVQISVPPDARLGRQYYAQAWAFFQFILTEHAEGLRSYLRELYQQPPGRRDSRIMWREFTRAFGPPEDLEGTWNAFLDRQQGVLASVPPASPPS